MNGPGVHDPKKCPLCSQVRHPSQAATRRHLAEHPLPTQKTGGA